MLRTDTLHCCLALQNDRGFKSSLGFLFVLFLSIRIIMFNGVFLFYIKFGTRHATWENL